MVRRGGRPDTTIHLWDAHTAQPKPPRHKYGIGTIVFSPDGHTLASASWDNTVRLWNVHTGANRAILADRECLYSGVQDGRTLASGGKSTTIYLWDIGTARRQATLPGHTEPIQTIVFSPDGGTLVSAGRDRKIRLWDIQTEQLKATFAGNIGQIKSLAFSSDGRIPVQFEWDVDSGRRLGVFTGHTNTVNTLVFSPDGRTLASGSEHGTALLWDFTPFLLQVPGDVNSDGVVNVQDLVLIALHFGETGVNTADVTGDGVVNPRFSASRRIDRINRNR